MDDTTIPIIDIGALRRRDPAGSLEAAQQAVIAACETQLGATLRA